MALMAEFVTNKEIAAELTLSISTVRWYIKQIYSKLGVHSRVKAIERIHELQEASNVEAVEPFEEPQLLAEDPSLAFVRTTLDVGWYDRDCAGWEYFAVFKYSGDKSRASADSDHAFNPKPNKV